MKRYHTIILGEVHGTVQSPLFVSQLVRKLAATQHEVILALELPQSQQQSIDKFTRSGNEQDLRTSSFFSAPLENQYGWASRAVVGLLSAVRKFPNIRIICFDPDNYLSANDRDEKMANKLLENMPKNDQSNMAVLVGVLHAKKSPIDILGKMFTPMTHILLNMENCNSHKLLTVMLSWEKAKVWGKVSFSKEEQAVFGKHILPAGDPSYVKSTHYNSYFLFENFEGYDATLFIRNIDASPPAFDSNTAK